MLDEMIEKLEQFQSQHEITSDDFKSWRDGPITKIMLADIKVKLMKTINELIDSDSAIKAEDLVFINAAKQVFYELANWEPEVVKHG